MRYTCFFAVLTICLLGAASAFAQQGSVLPLLSNQYAAQNDADVSFLNEKDTVPPKSITETTAGTDVSNNCLSCDACQNACNMYYCNRCCGGSRLLLGVEYMNWQASRDATSYAGTLSHPTGSIHGLPIASDSSYVSHLKDARYGRDGGFRTYIGYRMDNLWDVRFRYTYFNSNGNASLGDPTVDSNSVLANRLDRSLADDILNVDFDDGIVDYASQKIGLDLDTYDIEFRRQIRLDSRRLAVSVMGGFRFAEINQTSQIVYQDFDGTNLRSANIDEMIGMSAAGLMAGGEAHYLIGWNTSFFARGSVSVLCTQFDASRREVQLGTTNAGIRYIDDRMRTVIPVLELNAGLRWQRGRFHVAVGYDMATWFNMVQGIDTGLQDDVDGGTNGYRIDRSNLSFDGFFFETGFVF